MLMRRAWVALSCGVLVACGGGEGGSGADPDAGAADGPGSGGADAALAVPHQAVFRSDWREVGLGTSNSLVSDGGRWDQILGTDRGEVIDAPVGFPTAHALRVASRGGGFVNLRRTGLPVPPVGATRNYRWYYRHDQPFWAQDNQQHPIQDGNAQGDISWSFNTDTLGDTTWRLYLGVQVNSGENLFERGRWYSPTLDTGQVYRVELQVHRTSDDTFALHAQVFDPGGAQVLGDADFTSLEREPTTLADGPILTFNRDTSRPFSGADTLNGLNAGCNGITGAPPDGFPYAVQAGFAVVDGLPVESFIGPYGRVDGEVPRP